MMKIDKILLFLLTCVLAATPGAAQNPDMAINYPDIIKSFEKSVKDDPLNYALKYELSTLYAEWGKNVPKRSVYAFNKALVIVDQILKAQPESLTGHIMDVQLCLLLGDKEKTYSAGQSLLLYYPDHTLTLKLIAKTGKEIGKPYDTYLRKLLELNPADIDARRELEAYEAALKAKLAEKKPKAKAPAKPAAPKVETPVVEKEEIPAAATDAPAAATGGYKFAKDKIYTFSVQAVINKADSIKADYTLTIVDVTDAGAQVKVSIAGTKPAEVPENFTVTVPTQGGLKGLPANVQQSLIQFIFLPLPAALKDKQSVSGPFYLAAINGEAEGKIEYNFSPATGEGTAFFYTLQLSGLANDALCEGDGAGVLGKDDLLVKEFDANLVYSGEQEAEITITIRRKE